MTNESRERGELRGAVPEGHSRPGGRGMVREVNDTQVDIEERLSYHVYAYSKDEEALQIVA